MGRESTDYFEQSKMGGLQVMRESSGPSNFKLSVTKPSSDGKSKTYGSSIWNLFINSNLHGYYTYMYFSLHSYQTCTVFHSNFESPGLHSKIKSECMIHFHEHNLYQSYK